jgi:hypothetical protein
MDLRTLHTNFSEVKIPKELKSSVCQKHNLKCRIYSSIVSTPKWPDLSLLEILNAMTAIVYGVIIKESLYNHPFLGRKNGLSPVNSIDGN